MAARNQNRSVVFFDDDPVTYSIQNTSSHLVMAWIQDSITEAELLMFLHQLRTLWEEGVPSVDFIRDVYNDTIMLETSIWFYQYGVSL